MRLQDRGKEQCEALHKLLAIVALYIELLDVLRLHDVGEIRDEVRVHLLHFGVILSIHALRVDGRNLSKALQRVAAEVRLREELVQKHVDQRCFKHVVQRNPEEESEEALQGRLQRGDILGVLHHKFAELIDQLEFPCEAFLE